jgi:hypothetical protein
MTSPVFERKKKVLQEKGNSMRPNTVVMQYAPSRAVHVVSNSSRQKSQNRPLTVVYLHPHRQA